MNAILFRAMLTLTLSLAAPAAWPHAFLERAAPSAGSQFPAAPPRLTLRFTELVEPLFCTIELLGPAGAAVTLPAPKPDPEGRTLLVDLPRLAAGTYTVIWHVTSVDTHKTEGRYQFTVGP